MSKVNARWKIDDSGILRWEGGGCRPAEDTEREALARIGELEEALYFYAQGVRRDDQDEPFDISDEVASDLGETARNALYYGKCGTIGGEIAGTARRKQARYLRARQKHDQ